MLQKVRGLELREMKDTEVCCGFGGSFAAKFEPISVGMGEQKLENAMETGAEYLISTDASCLMHIEGYAKKKNQNIKMIAIQHVKQYIGGIFGINLPLKFMNVAKIAF